MPHLFLIYLLSILWLNPHARAKLYTSIFSITEVIELQSGGTASDIWSVGCTVIELITGYPPYFHLQPVSAMFHIVTSDVCSLISKPPPSCFNIFVSIFFFIYVNICSLITRAYLVSLFAMITHHQMFNSQLDGFCRARLYQILCLCPWWISYHIASKNKYVLYPIQICIFHSDNHGFFFDVFSDQMNTLISNKSYFHCFFFCRSLPYDIQLKSYWVMHGYVVWLRSLEA